MREVPVFFAQKKTKTKAVIFVLWCVQHPSGVWTLLNSLPHPPFALSVSEMSPDVLPSASSSYSATDQLC